MAKKETGLKKILGTTTTVKRRGPQELYVAHVQAVEVAIAKLGGVRGLDLPDGVLLATGERLKDLADGAVEKLKIAASLHRLEVDPEPFNLDLFTKEAESDDNSAHLSTDDVIEATS